MTKKAKIEDVPCYQCICLALCRRRNLFELEKICSLLPKYYKGKRADYLEWSLLVKVLKE